MNGSHIAMAPYRFETFGVKMVVVANAKGTLTCTGSFTEYTLLLITKRVARRNVCFYPTRASTVAYNASCQRGSRWGTLCFLKSSGR